ncbi:hypothetical protein [Nocardia wallacei]|uniref:hypothetical protein n=1 Tax=Nocardia wallacei TaxID=480035 RepID=UPI002456EC1F|nr:hypothetical protein [Nocardia wallacei]
MQRADSEGCLQRRRRDAETLCGRIVLGSGSGTQRTGGHWLAVVLLLVGRRAVVPRRVGADDRVRVGDARGWTVEAMVGVLADPVSAAPESTELLISAARAGAVTRQQIGSVFGDGDGIDLDAAFFQFVIAGLVGVDSGFLPEVDAIAVVRDHIRREGFDTTEFPLSTLTADRLGVGWMVHSPVRDDGFAVDRAVFYVADDGVVEQSTESVSTSEYSAGFEQRFWLRRDDRF